MRSEIIVLSGANHLNIKSTCEFESGLFACGESSFRLLCSVRYKPVTIIQSFPNTNNNLMELILAIDSAKRSGASNINVILMIFPYSRQDKKHKSGVPISAKIVCDMLREAQADRVITFDLHNEAIEGFMHPSVVFDHIELTSFLAYNLKENINDISDWTFVSPDAGAIKRTKKLMDACGASKMAVVDKTRTTPGVVDEVNLIGSVEYQNCIVVDDMVSSGGTLLAVEKELIHKGALSVTLCCSHGIFTSGEEMFRESNIFVTNTLPLSGLVDFFDISPLIKKLVISIDSGTDLRSFFRYSS